MGALVAVILVCATGTPVDRCTRETALDVQVLPGTPSPMACAMGAQQALARDPARLEGAYPRTLCEHRKEG